MKIGIISINMHTKVLNFASPLHSYALQEFLRQHGIESTIIEYKPNYYKRFDVRHPLYYYERHPDANAATQERKLKKWKALFSERERRYDRFEEFIRTYYRKTDKCYTAKILDKEDPGFDCYICATDVIWKYNKKSGFDRGYFLACRQMEGKKKIAYAASHNEGRKGFTAEQAKVFFDHISDIDYISVREKSLQDYIRENSDLPVAHVLDPIFFHEKEFYYNMAVRPKEKGYVLLYIVIEQAKELVKAAAAFADALQLELIELSENLEDADIPGKAHHKVIYGIGIEEWLGYMQNAAYIFTNSFHACCFSIIFGKQFFAGERAGDKIDSLLEQFHLLGRRIKGKACNLAKKAAAIDFEEVDKLRQDYTEESAAFLLNAIRELERGEHKNHRYLVHDSIYAANDSAIKSFVMLSKQKAKDLLKCWFDIKKI